MDFAVKHEGLPLVGVDGKPIHIAYIPQEHAYYWCRGDNVWHKRNEQTTKLHLKAAGLASVKLKGHVLSELDAVLVKIHNEHVVDLALPLSGWLHGTLETNGQTVLVTKGCQPTEAAEVPWDNLRRYLLELMGEIPFRHIVGWWQWARKSIFGPDALPGQIPIFIGPPGAGKSMVQSLTTSLLGGRSASPFGYMAGRSDFNADLFVADHLVIEDQFFETGRSRREFGSRMKELAVNHVQTCHPKGRQKIYLRPKWRCSMSMNHEREHLNVLPPMDESLLDKIMLIKCQLPVFLQTMLQQEDGWENWNNIMAAELPGLAHYIDNYSIPPALRSERYGVISYHDSELLESEAENSVEEVFYGCIKHDLPPVLTTPFWEGTATDLERLLTASTMPSVKQTGKLLSWPGACGTYLGRLEKRYPSTFAKRRVKGKNLWRIDIGELA